MSFVLKAAKASAAALIIGGHVVWGLGVWTKNINDETHGYVGPRATLWQRYVASLRNNIGTFRSAKIV